MNINGYEKETINAKVGRSNQPSERTEKLKNEEKKKKRMKNRETLDPHDAAIFQKET